MADSINGQLPPVERQFLAEMSCRTKLKTVERIRAFEHGPPPVHTPDGRDTGTRYDSFEAPAASFNSPARFTDRVEVNVIDTLSSRSVGAAVLFVCPDHKADSDAALAFAVRAAALLSEGVGIVIVDIVPGPPTWATHLHSLVAVYPAARRPRGGESSILVVQPTAFDHVEQYLVWHHSVATDFPLPTVPVPIVGAMLMKLDLEATYSETCQRSRIP